MADKIEQHIANSGFKNLAVQWLIENSTSHIKQLFVLYAINNVSTPFSRQV